MTYAKVLLVMSRLSTRLLEAPCRVSQLLGLSRPDVALPVICQILLPPPPRDLKEGSLRLAYIFYGVLHDVADNGNLFRLSQSLGSSESLLL